MTWLRDLMVRCQIENYPVFVARNKDGKIVRGIDINAIPTIYNDSSTLTYDEICQAEESATKLGLNEEDAT